MTFDELNLSKALLNALADLEYLHPTPIQREAFPIIMSGRDVVGVAQTGTGKTFAYLLPLIRQLKFSKQLNPRILVLVPTRELVVQQVIEIEKLTTYTNLRVAGVYGGTNINTQKLAIMQGVDIVVGTPGRTLDLCLHGVLKTKDLKKLVIDEVDEMLNLGFRRQLTDILDVLPKRRQHLLFSATLTDEVSAIIEDFFDNPKRIVIAAHGTPLEQIEQIGYELPNFYTKINLLKHLLANAAELQKVLVFVSTKKLADRVFELLEEDFPEELGVIHSNKSQNLRLKTVERFGDGTHRALIATDIIARGIDISEVTHVINFDTPEEPTSYIHRIGRTGRADKTGVAISFIKTSEEPLLEAIETLMQMQIPMAHLPEEVEISSELTFEEANPPSNQKLYTKAPSLKDSGGAFHEKKAKNMKVNRAQEKRMARRKEKQKARRRKKK